MEKEDEDEEEQKRRGRVEGGVKRGGEGQGEWVMIGGVENFFFFPLQTGQEKNQRSRQFTC